MGKGYSISKEDYALLQRYKARDQIATSEQQAFELQQTVQRLEQNIRIRDREIKFKLGQVESGIIIEKNDSMKDGLKVPYQLETDIDMLQLDQTRDKLLLEKAKAEAIKYDNPDKTVSS